MIKLINLDDRSEKSFQSHTGPILSVSIDPLKKYLASSSCDGTACLWSIDSRQIHHQWKQVLQSSNDFENSPSLCRVAWQPSMGELFALPRNDCVEIYRRGQWENCHRRVAHSEMKTFSIAAFSADGSLLAASTTQSIVAIWRVSDLQKSSSGSVAPMSMLYLMQSVVCSICFSTLEKTCLALTETSGQLRLVKVVDLNYSSSAPMIDSVKTQSKPLSKGMTMKDVDDLFADDDELDMMDDISFGASENKQDSNNAFKSSKRPEIEHDIASNFDIQTDSPIGDDVQQDDISYDIGAIKSKYEPIIFGENDPSGKGMSDRVGSSSSATTAFSSRLPSELIIDGERVSSSDLLGLLRAPRPIAPIKQSAFQSGATPTHYRQRFMVCPRIFVFYLN